MESEKGIAVRSFSQARDSLDERIKNAQEALEKWPSWMKSSGEFQGSDRKDSDQSNTQVRLKST